MTRCSGCGAPVVWVSTDRRKMPVNADPDPDRGNVVILSGDHALVLGRTEAERRRAAGDELHLSHFATCPNAGDYRKDKKT